ncbi:MAG: CHAT domain-containing protein [Candidatus Eisenbacteria bacterium]|nr:CHAT domain-containing protein [Candidatus Eisenbacteria bacterium]
MVLLRPRPGGFPARTLRAPAHAGSGSRRLAVLAMAASLLASGAAADGIAGATRGPAAFWDRYVAADALLEAAPDSALALAERLIREDEAGFLGHWVRGAWLAVHDTSRVPDILRRADAAPDSTGLQVEAGTLHFALRHGAAGRMAFDRARDGYLAAERAADASRAALWKVIKNRDRSDVARMAWDLAAADSLARSSGDPAAIADVLIHRGSFLARRDEAGAVELLREAVAQLAPLGPSYQLVNGQRLMASSLKQQGALDEALERYRSAMEAAHALGDSAQEVQALLGMGLVQQALGAIPQALEIAMRALPRAIRTGRTAIMANAYDNLSSACLASGRYREARDQADSGLAVLERAGADPDSKVATLDKLGAVEALLGNFDAARARFEQALAMCRARDLKTRLSVILLHLATLETDLGDAARARPLVEEGLRAARESGQRRSETYLLVLHSRILSALDDDEGALRTAREGQRLARQVEPRTLWGLWQAEAEALDRLGRTREALAVLDSAIARLPELPDSSNLARVLTLKGRVHLERHEVQPALATLEQALLVTRRFAGREREAYVQIVLGPALLAAGRGREAIAALQAGLRWFEGARASAGASEERSGFQSTFQDAYVALAWAYARSGSPRAAFATMERSRAKEMRALFGVDSPGLRHKVSTRLASRLEGVESELTALQGELRREYSTGSGQRSRRLRALESRSDSLKGAWTELERRVEREAPAYARETGVLPPVTAARVERALGPGERLIAFMVGRDDATLLFDVRPGRTEVHRLPWDEAAIARRVAALASRIERGDSAGWRTLARALADTLLGPCRLAERPPRTLFVIPDAALHYVPFEALLVPGAAGVRRHVVELSEVVYATSATLLFNPPHLGPRRPAAGTRVPLVAFGDPAVGDTSALLARRSLDPGTLPSIGPLPHARREVLALQGLYPGARIHVGAEATEARFLSEAADAPILHVAAHAFVDDRHPKFSGIVLAPDIAGDGHPPPDDGLVQAYEVLERSYDLDLATVSACESGRGALLRGEGLIGLSRAFRLAGARNLVVSLWKVDDAATADFMAEFYARLSRGATPAAALRGAKLAFLGGSGGAAAAATTAEEDATRGVGRRPRAASHAEPSAWAAFVLIGTRER